MLVGGCSARPSESDQRTDCARVPAAGVHARTRTHARTHARARSHAHARTHTRTHTRTVTRNRASTCTAAAVLTLCLLFLVFARRARGWLLRGTRSGGKPRPGRSRCQRPRRRLGVCICPVAVVAVVRQTPLVCIDTDAFCMVGWSTAPEARCRADDDNGTTTGRSSSSFQRDAKTPTGVRAALKANNSVLEY